MIEIKIDDREFKNYIKLLVERAVDLRPLMRNIAGMMHDAVEKNFEKEGRPKWKPLSRKTIEARAKKGHWPGKILKVKGALATSISRSYNERQAIVGTNKDYAAIHQFGRKAGRGRKVNIPARPFLKLTEQDLSDIKEAVIEYLRRK